MRTVLLGLCALASFVDLTPETAAQTVTATLGVPTVDLDWVWNDECQCWVWSGPQFQGDYEGHSFLKEYFLNHQFSISSKIRLRILVAAAEHSAKRYRWRVSVAIALVFPNLFAVSKTDRDPCMNWFFRTLKL